MDVDVDTAFLCEESLDTLPQALESSGVDELTEGLEKPTIDAFWFFAWPLLKESGWEKVGQS